MATVETDQVASGLIYVAYRGVGARNLPDGMTAPKFVRRNLDKPGLGKDLQRVKYGRHEYLLPQSTLPGAARAAKPKGNGKAKTPELPRNNERLTPRPSANCWSPDVSGPNPEWEGRGRRVPIKAQREGHISRSSKRLRR